MAVLEFLDKGIESSNLIEIKLPQTKSNIIQKNEGVIFCSRYKGLRGLFRKDVEESKEFGRKICSVVKEKLNNQGFFTTDELPDYGISEDEVKIIYEKTNSRKDDLVVIFVYGREEAQKTKDALDLTLQNYRLSIS